MYIHVCSIRAFRPTLGELQFLTTAYTIPMLRVSNTSTHWISSKPGFGGSSCCGFQFILPKFDLGLVY